MGKTAFAILGATLPDTALRDFLTIPYDQLEEMNLAVKQARIDRVPAETVREQRIAYLHGEKRIKAAILCIDCNTACYSKIKGHFCQCTKFKQYQC